MKKMFKSVATIIAFLMIGRHAAEFVNTYYWWFAALFLVSLTGQLFTNIIENKSSQS
ncbi:hypothetical protein [Aquibacillus rhizosphaerae]|uniref:Uncharacterized protein n=1 Tax=Aquibacillus rhizosphaerae TaxID=3051431 RepID=A0ABT7L3X5_9BACI|nr:hypothetical protein [Aquibacillus sp. LR5S19]MDL4840570.1 hypothetical protein [Aquibacillus sp. LR5S19]